MEGLLALNPRSPRTGGNPSHGGESRLLTRVLWARVKRRNGGRLNLQSGFFATSQFRRYGNKTYQSL